jgi:diketogulonate reductase-like aldo/keto reductase
MSDTDGLRYKRLPLNNGSDEIPALGFGTLIPDPAAKEAVRTSLEVGFRQFDCAERYRNEEQVGAASCVEQERANCGVLRRMLSGAWTRCSSM